MPSVRGAFKDGISPARSALSSSQSTQRKSFKKVYANVFSQPVKEATTGLNMCRLLVVFSSHDGMRDMFPDSTALVVHHTGNNTEATGRSRGSSALKAALDVEILCMNYTLAFTKCKDTEAPEPIDFKLQVVEVGIKPDGAPITSCVVVYGEKPAKARMTAVKKVDGSNKSLLEIIEKHLTGEVEEIRPLFYAAEKNRLNDPDRKQGTLKTSFTRAILFLVEQKIITQNGSILQTAQTAQDGTNRHNVKPCNGTNGTHPLEAAQRLRRICRNL